MKNLNEIDPSDLDPSNEAERKELARRAIVLLNIIEEKFMNSELSSLRYITYLLGR